ICRTISVSESSTSFTDQFCQNSRSSDRKWKSFFAFDKLLRQIHQNHEERGMLKNRFALVILIVVLALMTGVALAQAPQGGGRGGGRGGGGIITITMTSTSFPDGGEIPAKYAGGQGVSPQLSWTGAPANTMSYVLIMHDVDAATQPNISSDISHWVV